MCGASFWRNKSGINVDDFAAGAKHATQESRLRLLHFNILHNIYPTNILLNRMKKKPTEKCDHCDQTDFIEHFFIHCSKLKYFWPLVHNTILQHTSINLPLTDSVILLGLPVSSCKYSKVEVGVINHILLIAKMCISMMRKRADHHVRDVRIIFETQWTLRKNHLKSLEYG